MEASSPALLLYEQVKHLARTGVNLPWVMALLPTLIQVVQRGVPGKHRGAVKRQVALDLIVLLLQKSEASQDVIDSALELAGPVIDTLCAVATGGIDLHKVRASCFKICGGGK